MDAEAPRNIKKLDKYVPLDMSLCASSSAPLIVPLTEALHTIDAPCKINLHLRIKDRRPDGFHDLESVFLPLDFGDTLFFDLAEEDGVCDIRIDWEAPREDFLVEKNLVFKAVSLFRLKTGFRRGVKIRLVKRVPAGAGLGGGSSDAAATLRAMDAVAETRLPLAALSEMAAELGSDMPFFLHGSPAYVEGRGERIHVIAAPLDFAVLVVCPAFGSNTAAAYRALDEARLGIVPPGKPPLDKPHDARHPSEDELARALAGHPSRWPFVNDFLPVFLAGEHADDYRSILDGLKQAGADFCGLSGAGSSCFGVFTDRRVAKEAKNTLFIKNSAHNTMLTSCFFRTGVLL